MSKEITEKLRGDKFEYVCVNRGVRSIQLGSNSYLW